jgi:heat shock protein HtpX
MDREGRMGREAVDALDRAADMLPLACTCGVRIKLPPDLRAPRVKCPRCGRTHDTPAAQAAWDAPKEISYQRKGTGCEAFRCACEHTVQISPAFSAPRLTCPKCGRRIRIE